MAPLRFEALARDFLRMLRGSRSQVAFSRRLKYRSNVAYLWESGRHWPTAAKTLYAAGRVGIDVRAAITRFYREPPAWLLRADLTDPAQVARFLDDLRGGTAILELADRTGRSRYAVARWLKGETEPRLPDFLRLIEATSQRVLDFLGQMVDVGSMPSARTAWRQLVAARSLLARAPWSPAVLLALQTEAYRKLGKHEPGWIARRLGLPPELEERSLELLAASGQIRKARGRWRVTRVQSIDTRSSPGAGLRLREWWAQVGLDYIRKERSGLFSFNVFSISSADLERLEDMHRAYFRAMRALIANSEPPEHVVVANVQLFELSREPERQSSAG